MHTLVCIFRVFKNKVIVFATKKIHSGESWTGGMLLFRVIFCLPVSFCHSLPNCSPSRMSQGQRPFLFVQAPEEEESIRSPFTSAYLHCFYCPVVFP